MALGTSSPFLSENMPSIPSGFTRLNTKYVDGSVERFKA